MRPRCANLRRDDSIIAVFVSGAGERGLCAGGDIRELFNARDVSPNPYKEFWREEYRLNAQIAAFPKPYVVLMDGVVMGGGVGVSAHGNARVVTERTRLAMPETGIGFIPDVGGTWLLSRAGAPGTFMALSGATICAADAIFVGLADYFIPFAEIEALRARLTTIATAPQARVVLTELAREPPRSPLAEHSALLGAAMTCESVEDILAALRANASSFARETAALIASRSPTSLKLTHRLLKLALHTRDLRDCLVNEFRAACSLLHTHDLYEGVRAAIIDKDRCPRWSPAALEEIDPATIDALLRGTGDVDPF